jgi:hypothetical protein
MAALSMPAYCWESLQVIALDVSSNLKKGRMRHPFMGWTMRAPIQDASIVCSIDRYHKCKE